MTIGALAHSQTSNLVGPNPDFVKLRRCREDIGIALGISAKSLELSMGMSSDFVEAIQMGSTNVRVGSSIFGSRNYPKKEKEESVEKNIEAAKIQT